MRSRQSRCRSIDTGQRAKRGAMFQLDINHQNADRSVKCNMSRRQRGRKSKGNQSRELCLAGSWQGVTVSAPPLRPDIQTSTTDDCLCTIVFAKDGAFIVNEQTSVSPCIKRDTFCSSVVRQMKTIHRSLNHTCLSPASNFGEGRLNCGCSCKFVSMFVSAPTVHWSAEALVVSLSDDSKDC